MEEKKEIHNNYCNLRIFNFENETQEICLFKDDIKKLLNDKHVYIKSMIPNVTYEEVVCQAICKKYKIRTVRASCINEKQFNEFLTFANFDGEKGGISCPFRLKVDPYQYQNNIRQLLFPEEEFNNKPFLMIDENFYLQFKILPYTDYDLLLTFNS